jgi:hypothetical protein
MVAGEFLIASGVYSNEQDIIDQLDYHMTADFGWSRIEIITDTGSDNDRAWISLGEDSDKYMALYARMRGNANDIIFYGYTFWDSGAGTDEVHNSTESKIQADGSSEWWFIGNKDAVYVTLTPPSQAGAMMGGIGYMDTYYDSSIDPYPLFVMGQNVITDTFSNTFRVRSYAFSPDGFLSPSSTVISGGHTGHLADDLDFLVNLGSPSPRDSKYAMLKPSFFVPKSTSLVFGEVRGELPGLYQISGVDFVAGSVISVSGVVGGGEKDFFISKTSNSICYALGPIASVSG